MAAGPLDSPPHQGAALSVRDEGAARDRAKAPQRLEDKGFVERDSDLPVHLFSAKISRWLGSSSARASFLALLPLGIVRAQEAGDDGAKPTREEIAEVWRKIREAVAAGQITEEEAKPSGSPT